MIESFSFRILDFKPILGQLALTSQLRLSYYNSAANYFGIAGKILLIPVSTVYQIKMRFEDFVTPKRVKERDSAIYIVVAQKIKDI
jgi:hypothetical protein